MKIGRYEIAWYGWRDWYWGFWRARYLGFLYVWVTDIGPICIRKRAK